MKPRLMVRATLGSATLFASALSACGGAIQFSDSTPIVLASPVPPTQEPRVEVQKDRIVINEKIQFEVDKAEILPVSHGLLNEVVNAMREHPDIKKIDIVGHTDNDGDEKYNQSLSDRRAKAVRQYLIQQGIQTDRLHAKGMGESTPIADNATAEGREKNRRVEFLIAEQSEVTR